MIPQQQTPPKRPRLSLQTKTAPTPATRSSRSYAVDPRDPTVFNTLSNVYVTAIERSTPVVAEAPLPNSLHPILLPSTVESQPKDLSQRVVTPYIASYPETPLSATASSPRPMEINFPSVMTATPPLSAGPVESNNSNVFSFSRDDISSNAQVTSPSRSEPKSASRAMRSFASLSIQQTPPPYIHPQSLHSILRNSPLPPPTAIQLRSPRRQSLRLQEKAAKRVGYNNPLTQEIVNNMYTKSHIDLLCEDASPVTPLSATLMSPTSPDMAASFNTNEVQDGGQTPGPYEDMRRRMTGLSSSFSSGSKGSPSSPTSPAGIRKRKKKEKKRRWVWTIGRDDDDDEEELGGSMMALKAKAENATKDKGNVPILAIPMIKPPKIKVSFTNEPPTPSIESTGSESESHDVYMSDTSSCASHIENRGLTPSEMDVDVATPIAPPQEQQQHQQNTDRNQLTPVPDTVTLAQGPQVQQFRDSPIPPEIL